MQPRVAAGGRPERASSWAILFDLQACISEPVRIIHYAVDVVRRLFCIRGRGRGMESARGSGRETVNIADERTGEKVTPAANYDYNHLNGVGVDDLHSSDDDDRSNFDDYEEEEEEEEEEEKEDHGRPPPSHRICYHGDSYNVKIAYSLSRYLVEILSVRPRFPFAGTFVAFNDCSAYYFSCQKGQLHRNVDSQGNLILRAQCGAIEDGFRIKIEIPDDDNRIEAGNLSFTVDPYACNYVITRTVFMEDGRKIDVTFVPMYRAIQANVFVNLDLTAGSGSSAGGTIYYVYGEITAHHQLYTDKNVMLFFCGEDSKSEVIDGELRLLRTWAAVPVYLDPLLIIKLSLHVSTNPEHDHDGCTISFQGDLTFDRDQYEKTICNADHGEVKVSITYQ